MVVEEVASNNEVFIEDDEPLDSPIDQENK